MKANGAVLWEGASLLDGAPIVVIATGLARSSSNRKTGALVQTYILRADVSPTDAVRTGADSSICGDCPHRGRIRAESPDATLTSAPQPSADAQTVFEELAGRGHMVGRTCYVNVGQGPLNVWRAWKRGRYLSRGEGYHGRGFKLCDLGRGRLVRLGTYGDPAAVPAFVWAELTYYAAGHTGYTHQHKRCDPALKNLCMASVDSAAEAREAQAAGWRSFRVAMPGDSPREPGEAICPASNEAGKKLTCAQCLACNGANGRRGNITIRAHGGFAVIANIQRAPIRAPYFARSAA
jgi:hypothetical protein